MERDGQQLSARPALETEGLRYLHVTGESPRATGSYHRLPRAPPCSVGRPLLRAESGLGRPGEAWPAAGRHRTQVREEGLERARRPSRSHSALGGAVGLLFTRILYLMRSKPFRVAVTGAARPWAFSSRSRVTPATPRPALCRPPRPPLSISS